MPPVMLLVLPDLQLESPTKYRNFSDYRKAMTLRLSLASL